MESITLIDPGCPDNPQREGTIVFNFSGAWVPSIKFRPPPEREAKTARVNKSPGILLLSSINRKIPLSPIRIARSENRKEKNEERRKKDSRTPPAYLLKTHRSLAYSALACFRMGMSGAASLQRARKSW
jgi:hypothetical protein